MFLITNYNLSITITANQSVKASSPGFLVINLSDLGLLVLAPVVRAKLGAKMSNVESPKNEIRISGRGTTRLPRQNINIPHEKMQAFCRRWKITELALFGSVLREDFHPGSDIDVLVSFAPNAHWSLLDLVSMQDELSVIFNRKVDLVEREAIEQSENYIRRRHILSNMEPIYAAE